MTMKMTRTILTRKELQKEGTDALLSGRRLHDYVEFIKKRFPAEKDRRYASEWALRFQRNAEWEHSDHISRRALLHINKKRYSSKLKETGL